MSLSIDDSYGIGATLRWLEIAEALRSTEIALLHGLALVRGIDPDLSATEAILMTEADTDDLLATLHDLADRIERLQLQADQVQRGAFEIRLRSLQLEAEAALSAGTADVERAQLLARCLPTGTGFQALAAALRCTDAHETWGTTTIGHLLASFHDADPHLVRHVTSIATLSPDARWSQCDREQLARLATVLEHHAAAARCR